jgi:hypothetical protein
MVTANRAGKEALKQCVESESPAMLRTAEDGVWGNTPRRRSTLAFVSFAPTLDSFGEGTEMRGVLHACVSYVFIGTLARHKKAIVSQLAIIIRVRHDTPHSLNIN